MRAKPKRNPAIVWRLEKGMRELAWDRARKGEEYEDVGVLTLVLGETINQLNLVGAEIWTRLNGINTAEKIAAEIATLFQADPEEMHADVMAFLTDLEGKGWVTLSAGHGPQAPRWTAR